MAVFNHLNTRDPEPIIGARSDVDPYKPTSGPSRPRIRSRSSDGSELVLRVQDARRGKNSPIAKAMDNIAKEMAARELSREGMAPAPSVPAPHGKSYEAITRAVTNEEQYHDVAWKALDEERKNEEISVKNLEAHQANQRQRLEETLRAEKQKLLQEIRQRLQSKNDMIGRARLEDAFSSPYDFTAGRYCASGASTLISRPAEESFLSYSYRMGLEMVTKIECAEELWIRGRSEVWFEVGCCK